MNQPTFIFKIILVGDAGVGKTSLMMRFVDKRFVHDITATIGVDFSLKNLLLTPIDDSGTYINVSLQIWDVSGESKYRSILPYYIAGTDGILLVFDPADPRSLENLTGWLDITNIFLKGTVPSVLVAAKCDLRSIPDERSIETFMRRNKVIDYYRTSSLTGENVDIAFRTLVNLILNKRTVITSSFGTV